MLALKFFVFIGIVGYGINSIKMLRQDYSAKNKISLVVAVILLLFGIYMLVDALL